MIEVKAIRKNVADWLQATPAFTAIIPDSKVFSSWPQTPVDPPLCIIGMRRTVDDDYPAHSWVGEFYIDLYASTLGELDTLEDALYQSEQAGGLPATLTGDGVLCVAFQLSAIEEDRPVFEPTSSSYLFLNRRLVYNMRIVHSSES